MKQTVVNGPGVMGGFAADYGTVKGGRPCVPTQRWLNVYEGE
ncbi:MAG TPA: hypothetical protein PLY61_08105 [Anaerohalosphaeraceae bacterium]|nr:hypothetical protein [Anaerohalosphaeraceae bacterium]HRT86692.1 hypothetical protein [Anaerohalosphaeraceae bacterium]